MLVIIIIALFLGHGVELGNAVHPVELEVFQDSKAEELIFRGIVSEECQQLPPLSLNVFFQSSNCTMIYHSSDCRSFSHRLVAGSLIQFSDWMNRMPPGYIQLSYRLCSETEKGNNVTVTLYGEDKLRPVVEYADVCDCVNVPKSISDFGIESLNNHGNCLLLYQTNRCVGTSIRVEGGKNFISENLQLYSKIESFEPCTSPNHCFSFFASAIRYELQSSIQDHHLEKVTLSSVDKFYNNGTGHLERTYTIKGSLTESFTFTKTSAFSKLSSVSADASMKGEVSLEVTGSLGLSKIASVESTFKTSMSAAVSQALGTSQTFTNTNGDVALIANSKDYARSERVIVPACTEVEVSSFVNMVKNVPSNYVVYFRVTGKQGRKVLNSAQIRKRFVTEDMAYTSDENETVAIYRWNGTLTATVGLQSSVVVHGREISSCDSRKTANVTNSINLNSTGVEVTDSASPNSAVFPSGHPTILFEPEDENQGILQIYQGVLLGFFGFMLIGSVLLMIVWNYVDNNERLSIHLT